MRTCAKCHTPQPEGEFYRSARGSAGLRSYCKTCDRTAAKEYARARRLSDPEWERAKNRRTYAKHRVARIERQRQWAKNNPNKARNQAPKHLRRRYGLSIEAYNQAHAAQGGACLVCGSPEGRRRLSVDHDHLTGAFRGLLCQRCNMAIGLLRDEPRILRSAAEYLERNSQRAAG